MRTRRPVTSAVPVLLFGAAVLGWVAYAQVATAPSESLRLADLAPSPAEARAALPIVATPGGELVLRGLQATAQFTARGVSLSSKGARPVEWGIAGGARVQPRPERPARTRVNLLVGADPTQWRTNAPAFEAVRYPGVLPGVELVVESHPHGLKYSLLLAPGVDPDAIRLRYNGVEALAIAEGGAGLTVRTSAGLLRESALEVYQPTGSGRRKLEARFKDAGRHGAEWRYGIEVQGVDPKLPLVIDPVVAWATYLGGTGGETPRCFALHPGGSVYVAGATASSNFPGTDGGYSSTPGGGASDTFVAKLDRTGRELAWATYLGGNDRDEPYALAVDGAGNVFVVGQTLSTDFPLVSAFDPTTSAPGSWEAFATKLSPDGTALVWSSFYGGAGAEGLLAVAVDAAGNAYLGGTTNAITPLKGAIDSSFGGGGEGYLGRVGPGGALAWSTLLGGSDTESIQALAVEPSGTFVLVAGKTQSTNFPSFAPMYDSVRGGLQDAFVLALSSDGQSGLWSTYWGAMGDEDGLAVAIAGGKAFLAGWTTSSNMTSTTGGSFAGGKDVFVARFDVASTPTLEASSYLGGAAEDYANALVVDTAGHAYLVGKTSSSNLPVPGAFDATLSGASDGWVGRFEAVGSWSWVSYLGGSADEELFGIGVDSHDPANLVVAGWSTSSDFPTDGGFGPVQASKASAAADALIVKVAQDPTPPVAGLVEDGVGPGDLTRQTDTTSLSAHWSGFSDPESGSWFAYEWALGTSPGGSEVMGFVPVPGGSTSATRSGLSLTVGATYYATVRAMSSSGLTATASSNGVVVARPIGQACAQASECVTGQCVDGVCCDRVCAGDCEACTVAAGGQVDGTCGPLASTVVCRSASGPCDVEETCTGASGTCPPDAVESAGTEVAACGAYVCDGVAASCPTACATASGCGPGWECDAGVCSIPVDAGVVDGGATTSDGGTTTFDGGGEPVPDAGEPSDGGEVRDGGPGVPEVELGVEVLPGAGGGRVGSTAVLGFTARSDSSGPAENLWLRVYDLRGLALREASDRFPLGTLAPGQSVSIQVSVGVVGAPGSTAEAWAVLEGEAGPLGEPVRGALPIAGVSVDIGGCGCTGSPGVLPWLALGLLGWVRTRRSS